MDSSRSSSLKQKLESSSSSLRLRTLETSSSSSSLSSLARGGGGRGRGRGRGGGRGRNLSRGRGSGRNLNSPLSYVASGIVNYLQETNNNSHMPICTFYLAGKCTKGAKCRFYHPDMNSKEFIEAQQQQMQQIDTKANGNKNFIKPPREFDAFKAEAINMAKTAQDLEMNKFAIVTGPFYSIDIECVASGYGHTEKQRYPCRVSLVKGLEDNQNDVEVLVDEIVNLNGVEVASYMTALTGMTAEQCLDPARKNLDDIRSLVRSHLSADSILVGHSIQHDIDWLGLKPGADFKEAFDTSCIFRQRIPRNLGSAGNVLRGQVNGTRENEEVDRMRLNRSDSSSSRFDDDEGPDDTHLPFPTKYRLFSLRHCCIHLLDIDIQEKAHNPVMDAKYSLILFQKYQSATPELLRAVRDSLHRAPPTPSFASENPLVDGVVLSFGGYRLKSAGRFIWKWWITMKDRKREKEETPEATD